MSTEQGSARAPTVFVSYSHDSREHADRVLALADRLVQEGIDVILDQYETSPPEGWPRWMDRHIRSADFVLMVCTETYFRRVMGEEEPGKGLGVRWEGKLVYQHLYNADANVRFIPVLFAEGRTERIPTPLQDAMRYPVDTPEGYEDLYRRLTNQPRVRKPGLGKLRKLSKLHALPPREHKADFVPAMAPPLDKVREAETLSDLKARWEGLQSAADHNQRGFAFESWLHDLLVAQGFHVHGSFRRQDPEEQIDAALYYGFTTLLIEAKWYNRPIEPDHIDRFSGRLQRSPAGTLGVFFSVSGFNEGAIGAADSWLPSHPILLVDKPHMMALLANELPGTRWLEVFHFLAGRKGQSYVSMDDIRAEWASYPQQPAAVTVRAPGGPRVSLAKLPSTHPDLFGREKELAALDAAWEDGRVNVVSLVAWGGVGKSALVNKWLSQMERDNYRGAERVFGWSFYSQGAAEGRQVSADPFIAAALAWFGDPDPTQGSPWDKGQRLAELIKAQRTLLILDGLEPLQNPPPVETGRIKDPALSCLLRELARQNPGLLVITTRLAVDDLKDHLGNSALKIDLEDLSPVAGAAYLDHLGVKGSLNELERAAAEFGGHALALTLLGTYLATVYHGDVHQRDQVERVTDERAQGPHARRMLASYERWFADKPELDILRLMGLFDRPAAGGALELLRKEPALEGLTERVVGLSHADWQYAVQSLRAARLLAATDAQEPDTLDCHPLLREYCGEQVRTGHAEAWRAAHSRLFEYYVSSAREQPDTLEEMAPLYAAVAHGCQAGRHQEAEWDVFWTRIRRRQEAFSWSKLGAFGADLAALSGFFDPPWRTPVAGLRESSKAFVLNGAGFALRALGRLAEAAQPMQAGLEMHLAQKDWRNASRDANNLSELCLTLGDITRALAYAEQSVELADRSRDAFERMGNRTTLADAQHQAGQVAEAAALFRQAEEMQKQRQPEFPLLYSLQGFRYNDLLLSQGEYGKVERRANQTLQWMSNDPNAPVLTVALENLSLGRAHLQQAQSAGAGDITPAATHLEQAVQGLRQAGQQHHLPRGLLARAELQRVRGETDGARRDLDEALAIATRGEMRLYQADCHLEYTRLYLAGGDKAAARESLAKAKKLVEETGYHRRDAEVQELEAQVGELAR